MSASNQIVIGDTLPYTQATATSGQTVFGTNWTANYSTDVVVYQTPANTPADDETQQLTDSEFSVAFIGDQQQVQVTLVTGATQGDTITITRQTPADRENLYTNTNFTPTMLNNDFGILTLVDQQAQLVNQLIGPRYNYSADILTGVDNILPILGENQAWVKNSNGTAIVAVNIPEGGAAPADSTYITYTNETGNLPNSYQLLAGTNVTFTPGTNSLTINVTGSTIVSGTTNDLAYYASSGTALSPLATANDSVLVTNGTGVPSLSTTLPSGLTIPGYQPTITPGALSVTDDTNVTLTLGGIPATALLEATSITAGWTGQLAVERGGTGLSAVTAHYLPVGNGTSALTLIAPNATSGIPLISQGSSADPTYGTALIAGGGTGNTSFTAYSVICGGTTSTGAFQNVSGVGSTNQVLVSNGAGALPSWQSVPGLSPAALTKTDDTNVTLTLGGTPSTALLQATSITAGWTGVLAQSRGGTGFSAFGTGVATALQVNVGTAGAFVVNGGALGTPSSGTLSSCTGLPISTGVSGLGTGIATALAVNTGSAGAPVLFNGAGGTPSSINLTNATALPFTIKEIFFSSSQTYTPTTNAKYVFVEIWGGGGSGGGTGATSSGQAAAGGGGGGGGYCSVLYTAVQLGASAAIVIGSGGTSATAGANNGNSGGTSSFTPAGTGTALSAGGGAAGSGGSASSSASITSSASGGAASGSSFSITGMPGGNGSTGASGAFASSGAGGSSYGNVGGSSVTGGTSASGGIGPKGPGAASSGAWATASQSAQGSNAGAAGLCKVTEYIFT